MVSSGERKKQKTKVQKKKKREAMASRYNMKSIRKDVLNDVPFGIFAFHHMRHNADLMNRIQQCRTEL